LKIITLVEKKPVLTVEKGLAMFFLLLALGLFSCKTLGINQNGYAGLTPAQRNSIQPFAMETSKNRFGLPEDSVIIEEITFHDIQMLANQYAYVWIHEFVPSCSHLNTRELKALLELENNNKNGLKLILVSEVYDLKDIRYIFRFFGHPIIVYVLHHEDYSATTGKASRTLFRQLTSTNTGMRLTGHYFDDYILHNGQLVEVRPWKQPLQSFMSDFEKIMPSVK